MQDKDINKYGTCGFCGQTRMIEMSESEWKQKAEAAGITEHELADREATETCNCVSGANYRERIMALNIANDLIEGMFRNHYPEVADVLQEAKGIVYGGRTIRKITVTMPGEAGSATISYGKSGIKVEHRKVLHEEATTGF